MESSGVHYIIHIKQIRSSKRAGTTAICRPCKATATGHKAREHVSRCGAEEYYDFLRKAAEDKLFDPP